MMQQALPSRNRKGISNNIKCNNGSGEIYKFYRGKYGKDVPKGMSKQRFTAIIKDFNNITAQRLIEGELFNLPYYLGVLYVEKRKIRLAVKTTIAPDWKATYEWWEKSEDARINKKILYCLNEHTDGYRHKFVWYKRVRYFSRLKYYAFRPSRLVSRKLTTALKSTDIHKNYQTRC